MYAYGRKELPNFKLPTPMKGVEKPDFKGMYNQTKMISTIIRFKRLD
jgi:hypothetical protein